MENETTEQHPSTPPGKILAAKALYLLVILAWLFMPYLPIALLVKAIIGAVNRTN